MYTIGKIAKLAGVTTKTLRYYEKIGLIRHIHRNAHGVREYTENNIQWIQFIIRLKRTKMPLESMIIYADSYYDKNPDFGVRIDVLEAHMETMLKELEEINSTIDFIKYKIN